MSLNTILGLLGGAGAGFGAAYFIQNGKISKLKQDINRYSQASQALVSAESELKDARSRILILEQSENEVRRKLEQSYQGQIEEIQDSYQGQIAELNQMRSLKIELEQELEQVRGQLENAQNNHFNDLEALKQSHQVQLAQLQQGTAQVDVEAMQAEYQAQIQELEQAHEARLQEIEKGHQAKIYELEQAYQTQILELQEVREDEPDNFAFAPESPIIYSQEETTNAEVDFGQTFINPALLVDDESNETPEMGYLETWVAPVQEEVIARDDSRDMSHLETWYAPPMIEEETEDFDAPSAIQSSDSANYLETWMSEPEEAENPVVIEEMPQEMGYLETWVADEAEDSEEPRLSAWADSSLEVEENAALELGSDNFSFLESLAQSELEEDFPQETGEDFPFLESVSSEAGAEVVSISSLEELTALEEPNFAHPDSAFLELLPQEEESPSFNGFAATPADETEELFSFSEQAEEDLDLLNSLELELGESYQSNGNSELTAADTDLDFLNLLDSDNGDLESLASLSADEANDSLDDLFGEDFLGSNGWGATPELDEEREAVKENPGKLKQWY